MVLERLELLVLDNNGTMLDDLHLAYGSVEAIFSVLGVPCPTKEQYRNEISSDFMQFYWAHGVPRDVTGDQLNGIRKLYYKMRRSTAHFRADLGPFLIHCRDVRKIKAGVCSAEIGTTLMHYLQPLIESNFFSQGADGQPLIRGEAWPGKTEKLGELLEQAGVPAGRAALVDDSVEGIEQARALGMRTVAFVHGTGYNRLERLRRGKPDAMVASFAELRRTLDTLGW
jgi:beta-phosphoglucomutase-like phosphatase (HAD superfamily)